MEGAENIAKFIKPKSGPMPLSRDRVRGLKVGRSRIVLSLRVNSIMAMLDNT